MPFISFYCLIAVANHTWFFFFSYSLCSLNPSQFQLFIYSMPFPTLLNVTELKYTVMGTDFTSKLWWLTSTRGLLMLLGNHNTFSISSFVRFHKLCLHGFSFCSLQHLHPQPLVLSDYFGCYFTEKINAQRELLKPPTFYLPIYYQYPFTKPYLLLLLMTCYSLDKHNPYTCTLNLTVSPSQGHISGKFSLFSYIINFSFSIIYSPINILTCCYLSP